MAEIIDFNKQVSKEELHEAKEAMDKIVEDLNSDEYKDIMSMFGSLLELPDEQFVLVAPGVLESYKMTLNNPNDKIALVQAFNAQGLTAEDFSTEIGNLMTAVEELDISDSKKDFLKECFMAIENAVVSTEGIAKRLVAIPIELCNENAKIPQYAHQSDSGMDVYALDDITIRPGETVLVPTGIKVALPPGFELQVRPKSGRALKTKLRVANTPGTIDQGYRDEIKVIIENVEPPIKDIQAEMNLETGKLDVMSIEYGSSYYISKGEKFCQLVLAETPKAAFYRVDSVAEIGEDRGGGFGSTGK